MIKVINLQPKPLPIIHRPYMRGSLYKTFFIGIEGHYPKQIFERVEWKELTWAKVNLSPNEQVVSIGLVYGFHLSNGLTIHGLKHPCTSVALPIG